jgi:hypothetical protein
MVFGEGTPSQLVKKSDFDFALKGCGFSRTASYANSTPALAAEGRCRLSCDFFRSLFSRAAQRQ